MSKGLPADTPSAIRAACRSVMARNLPAISAIIASESERSADRIKAWAEVGKMGLGSADQAAVHVHAEGNVLLGVVALPALGEQDGSDMLEVVIPQRITAESEG